MLIDAGKGTHLRIAGGSIMVLTVAAQALVIGFYWWHDLTGSHLHIKLAVLSFGGWCLAGIALLLGRLLTPYISFIAPGAVLAGSIWAALEYMRQQGTPHWPWVDLLAITETLLMLAVAPVTGAWLAGWGSRRRRRSPSSDVKAMAQVFD